MKICRFNAKHKFGTEEERILHEDSCPDEKKSKCKRCPYNRTHIISNSFYKRHIEQCKDKKKKIEEESELESQIKNFNRSEENNFWELKNAIPENTNENINENTNENKENIHPIENSVEEEIEINFGQEDYLFRQVFI